MSFSIFFCTAGRLAISPITLSPSLCLPNTESSWYSLVSPTHTKFNAPRTAYDVTRDIISMYQNQEFKLFLCLSTKNYTNDKKCNHTNILRLDDGCLIEGVGVLMNFSGRIETMIISVV